MSIDLIMTEVHCPVCFRLTDVTTAVEDAVDSDPEGHVHSIERCEECGEDFTLIVHLSVTAVRA